MAAPYTARNSRAKHNKIYSSSQTIFGSFHARIGFIPARMRFHPRVTLAQWTPHSFDLCAYHTHAEIVGFEWDEEAKAGINFRKHSVPDAPMQFRSSMIHTPRFEDTLRHIIREDLRLRARLDQPGTLFP